jgi:MFS family permease
MSMSSPSADSASPLRNGTTNPKSSISTLRFYGLVFAPFALGHFMSYVLRSINAVLAPFLGASFALDARQIGIFTSAYFLAFAVAQLPVGIALDRYGPRRVQVVLLSTATVGCIWLSVAHSFIELAVARALTGVGLAACFMASLKAVSDWLPPTRMPSMNSYLLAVGGLGAIASTLPAQILVDALGWQAVFMLIAFAIAATALIIGFISPEPGTPRRRTPSTLGSLIDVYRDPAFLRTISVALVPHTVFFAVQGLWLGTWLNQLGILDSRRAALYLFAGMLTMVVGTVVVGRLTERASALGYKPLDIAAAGLWVFAGVQLLLIIDGQDYPFLVALAFPLFGAFAGLEFAIVAQSVPAALTGRASTSLNLLVFTGSFVVQFGFGALLSLWDLTPSGTYPVVAFQTAFSLLLLLQIPGLVIWVLSKLRNRLHRARLAE